VIVYQTQGSVLLHGLVQNDGINYAEMNEIMLFSHSPFILSVMHTYVFPLYCTEVWRMVSSRMLHHVALVRTDVLEELTASFIRVTRIGELGTTLGVTSNQHTLWRTLMKEALSSSKTSVLTRATQRNIPEDTILHSHCHENLKSYREVVFQTKISVWNYVWKAVFTSQVFLFMWQFYSRK
jgi:hypothetical protein